MTFPMQSTLDAGGQSAGNREYADREIRGGNIVGALISIKLRGARANIENSGGS